MTDTLAMDYARRMAVLAVKEAVELLESPPLLHTAEVTTLAKLGGEELLIKLRSRYEWKRVLQDALLERLVSNG